MKIALTCPASIPATQFGGIMFLCLDIAKESSKMGHDVTIFTTDLDFANNPKTFNKNLPRKEKFQNFIINRSHVWFSIHLFFVNPGIYFQMNKEEFDVIHTIGIRSYQSFIAALIAKKKKIPLIISDQGGLTTHPDQKSSLSKNILTFFQKPFIKFVINTATKISVPNEYEKNIFLNFSPSSKIRIIKNGINLDILDSSKEIDFKLKYNIKSDYILFLGRFSKIKGIDTLIESINLLKPKISNSKIKFVIMGVDFGFESKLQKMIKEYGLEDLVKIIKNPPREDVISAYGESELLVLPSVWELSPLVPLESFAFKKPVISTNSHGIPYTVQHNKNGLLVEPDNPTELANAIKNLLENPDLIQKLGEQGYNFVKSECNCVSMASNVLNLYEKTLKNNENK